MVGEVATVGDPGPSVLAQRMPGHVDNHGGNSAHDTPVQFSDLLTGGEDLLVAPKMALTPDDIIGGEFRVGDSIEFNQSGNVVLIGLTNFDVVGGSHRLGLLIGIKAKRCAAYDI
jgi:hypothetical protein